jgi:phage shock protein A
MNRVMSWHGNKMDGDEQMGWLKRFRDYTESRLSGKANEDYDEKQIAEVIETLKAEMAEAQVRIASLSAAIGDGRERREDLLELAKRRHDEAKLAVIHGDDASAKRALAEEQSFNGQYELALRETTKSEDTLSQLRNHVQMLENQVYGLSNRKEEYLARLHTAELAKMTADIRGGLDSRGRAFERLEEKVVQKELEAEAHGEVAGLPLGDGGNVTDNLPLTNTSVDEMLQKLQAALKEEGPTK